MATLLERWAAMDEAQLRDELADQWFGVGIMQSLLYREIRDLQQRISEQRIQINRLLADKASLAERLSCRTQESTDGR